MDELGVEAGLLLSWLLVIRATGKIETIEDEDWRGAVGVLK